MKPIILAELRRRKWSTFWWSLAVAALIGLTLAFYPTIRNQTAELNKSFGDLSPTVTDLFSDTGEFFSPVGYMSSQIFYFMFPLLLSILAIGLGSSLIAREEQSGTLELLLARPVSRRRLLTSKAISGLIIVAIVTAVGIITCLILGELVDVAVSFSGMILCAVQSMLLALIFGGVALLLSSWGELGRTASMGLAAAVGLVSYLSTSFEQNINILRTIAHLLPFHYYHPAQALSGQLSLWPVLGFSVVVLLLCVGAAQGFARRDLS
jgi:ABC-2 type transport system permease protein